MFLLLSSWTAQYLTPETLNTALALYVIFRSVALRHPDCRGTATRDRPTPRWCHVFPVLALVLVLIPIIKETELSWMLWPVVFAVDGLAIALAVITLSLTPILFVFLLSGLVAASWIMDMPASTAELPQMLIVIVAFAVFFMAAALLAGRKVFATVDAAGKPRDRETFANVGALSATFRSCCWRW